MLDSTLKDRSERVLVRNKGLFKAHNGNIWLAVSAKGATLVHRGDQEYHLELGVFDPNVDVAYLTRYYGSVTLEEK